jgi:hypothetical protein
MAGSCFSYFFKLTNYSSVTIDSGDQVRAFVFENGRTYRSYHQGKYVLPNDEQEKARLDFLHHVYSVWLDEKLFLVPIPPEKLNRVPDIGTGTGIWAIELSRLGG